MKQNHHITLAGTKTTPADICRWAQELFHVHARLAPHFARPEPHQRTLKYLQGILSDVARKNGWQLAEQAGEDHPYGMQRLLSQAVWDTDGVRDDLRAYVLLHLGAQGAVLAIDETSFPKRGTHSAGVGPHYCGTTGQVENCQVGVYLSYVTRHGHALIDRELYLPLNWCEDAKRRKAAHIPETVRFQTKPELARQMIARIHQAGGAFNWVVADSVYGSNFDLRTWLETQGIYYVLAVHCDEPVAFQALQGRRREEAALVETFLPERLIWHRLSMSQGTKGPRLFDWALLPMLHQWEDDGRHFLLIRRSLTDPQQKCYYFVFAPLGSTFREIVVAIGCRWHIEEDFENGKDLGLDHYEVRSYIGWYRYQTLVMLAMAYLMAMVAQEKTHAPSVLLLGDPPRVFPLLPLTVPEIHHLLARLIWPQPRNMHRALAWSRWRRSHQSRASYFHTKHRREAG